MLQRIGYLLFGIAAASLAGCASTPSTPKGYTTPAAYTSPPPTVRTVTHEYQLKVVDIDGDPVSGAALKLRAENDHSMSKSEECVSDAMGMCPAFRYEVNRDPSSKSGHSYISTLKGTVEASGYYTRKVGTLSYYGTPYMTGSDAVKTVTLQMLKPVDYLEDSLAKSAPDAVLRARVLSFLDVIRVQGFLNDAEVMLKGIGVSEFKGRKYLRVKINSTTTYNNLKFNKYDVGKRLFDDTVRKMLNPLNDAIAAPRAFQGYDLVVYGHSKSFADKDAKADKLEYRFLMPEASVRKYKDKDISGQALLDASVLLLDDERIDMKLQ